MLSYGTMQVPTIMVGESSKDLSATTGTYRGQEQRLFRSRNAQCFDIVSLVGLGESCIISPLHQTLASFSCLYCQGNSEIY